MKWREATFCEVLEFARTRIVVEADDRHMDHLPAGQWRSVVELFSDGSMVVAASNEFYGGGLCDPVFWIGEP